MLKTIKIPKEKRDRLLLSFIRIDEADTHESWCMYQLHVPTTYPLYTTIFPGLFVYLL
jgi:hypothetical protein